MAVRRVLHVLLAFVPAAAGASTQPPEGETPQACVVFSDAFYKFAQIRDGGYSRDQTLELVRKSRDVTSVPVVQDLMVQAAEFVYRHPATSPEQLRSRVQQECSLDRNGKVVFNGF